jgi:hypothetical protein
MRIVAMALAAVAAGAAVPSGARAGVKVEERSTFELAGPLGSLARMFGAGSSKDELSTVAVKGDRKRSTSGDSGSIVDLAEGELVAFDVKRGEYRVTSFEALRAAMEQARRDAAATPPRASERAPRSPERDRDVERALEAVQLDVEVKTTGRTRTINGFDTREVLLTVAAHARGTTLEQGGGIALRTEVWLTPRIAALKELTEFDRRFAGRYAASLYGGPSERDASAMEAAFASNPMLKDVLVKMKAEGAKLDGSPILTVVMVDLVPSAEDRARMAAEVEAEQRRSSARSRPQPTGKGLGGLLGGLARHAVERKVEEKVDAKLASAKDDAQSPTILRMTTEVVRVTTQVGGVDVALPAGLRRVQ